MVVSIKLVNYKQHKNFTFHPDKKSFFLIADSGQGKTVIIDAIRVSLGLGTFDQDALSAGEETGLLSVTHDFGDGHLYTVSRRLSKSAKKGSLRFEIRDENGGEHVLDKLLKRVLGIAYAMQFDYNKYFYECKSTEARTEHLIQVVAGDRGLLNLRSIRARIKDRHAIGGKMETYSSLLESAKLNADTLEEDKEKYDAPKSDEHYIEYAPYKEAKEQLIDQAQLEQDLSMVVDININYAMKAIELDDCEKEIADLQQKLKDAKEKQKDIKKYLRENANDIPYQLDLETELASAETQNARVQPIVDKELQNAKEYVMLFNQRRHEFMTGLGYLKEFLELKEQWDTIQASIDELENENLKIFKERIPVERISFQNDTVMYLCNDGLLRELCFPNISKGESIGIAVQIQRALNPNGNNLVIIPEAQSMGSALDEVVEECHKYGVQYIAEVTERKQKLSVVLEEEYFKNNL